MEKQFTVLYTHQKQKKAKTWHDGVLKHGGSGTKAVLYDEKGCRLDSLHLRVEDIQLGEQLESDRYYILVEEVKDISKPEPVTAKPAVTDNPKPQPSSQTTFSRARCAGLKRKNSGFMAPRMIKQACLGNSQGSETESDTIGGMSQQDNRGSNWSYISGPRIPPLPQNIHSLEGGGERFPEVSGRSVENSISSALPMTTVGRNVLNMYSTFGKPGNVSDSEQSSQESTLGGVGGCKRLLSPWSVYGSKNSSPSLGKGFESQSPSLSKPYLDKACFESLSPSLLSNPVVDKTGSSFSKRDQVEQNQGQSFLTKTGIQTCIDENPDRNIKRLNENFIFPETSCLKTSIDGNTNKNNACLNENPALSYKTERKCEDEDSTVTEIDNVQKTRNISQIMRLLRKNKTSETKFGNDVKTPGNSIQSSETVCNFTDGRNVAVVKVDQDETFTTDRLSIRVNERKPAVTSLISDVTHKETREILYKSEDNMNIKLKAETGYESNRQSFKECTQELDGDDNLAVNEENVENDVLGNEMKSKEYENMKTDNVLCSEEEENIGSFHINFSPLSFVLSSDDETEQKLENTNKHSKQKRSGHELGNSIDVSAKVTNKVQNNSRNHEKIDVASTDTFQQRQLNDNAKDRTVADKTVTCGDSQSSLLSNQNKKYEDSKPDNDVLEDIEQDFLKQTTKHSLNNTANAFPLLEENLVYRKLSTKGSNEEKSEQDKAISLGNLVEDIQHSVNEKDYFEDFGTSKTVSFISAKNNKIKKNDVKELETYSTCRKNDVISVGKNDRFDENEKFADNNGSVCSRTTSVSQDTMDFSCNTLEDDSQGYLYFEKELGKNNPRTRNERVDDNQERKNSVGERKNAGHKTAGDNENVTAFVTNNQSHTNNQMNTVALRMLRDKDELKVQRQSGHVKDILSSPDTALEQPLDKQHRGMALNTLESGQYFESSGLEDPLFDVSPSMTAPHPSKLLKRTRKYIAQGEPIAAVIGMGGVSSAVVSRALHITPANNTECHSPALEHTQSVQDSPFQRLNDSDWSAQSSPNFYVDCKSDNALITRTKQIKVALSSPYSGNDSSQSPEDLVKPVSQSSEEIYTQLYRPRPMYNRNNRQFDNMANTASFSHIKNSCNSTSPLPLYNHSRGSPDTTCFYNKPEQMFCKSPISDNGRIVPNNLVSCRLNNRRSTVTSNFLENSNEILQSEYTDSLRLQSEYTDSLRLPPNSGSVISTTANGHFNYCDNSTPKSQESMSWGIISPKITGNTETLDEKAEFELDKKFKNRFDMNVNQSNQWRKPMQNEHNKIIAIDSLESFHQSQQFDSQLSMDLFNNETEEQYNIHKWSHNRMLNNDSETRIFPKDYSQLPSVTPPQAQEPDEQGSCLSSDEKFKKTSRWQHFMSSQLSDDIEVDLQKLTKKIVNVEKSKKEFVELENSPGLYITQRQVLKKVTNSEEGTMVLPGTLANETISQLNSGSSEGTGKGANTTECENIKESPSHLEEFFLSPNQDNSFRKQVSDVTPKENSLRNFLKISGSLKSSSIANTMSTGDSFDQLLGEDDFGFEVALGYSQSRKHVGCVEQIVPSMDSVYGGETMNDAVQDENEHIVMKVDLDKKGHISEVQNKRFDKDVEKQNYNHSPDCRKSETFSKLNEEITNEADNCEDGNILNGVTNSHNEDVFERSNFENAEIRKDDKSHEKSQQNRKVEEVILEEELAEVMSLMQDLDQQLDEKENLPPFEVEDSNKTRESLVLDQKDRNSLSTQKSHGTEKKIENKCNFNLDESLDLTFSFDNSKDSEKPKKMSHSMRIVWKPPVKQSVRPELKQSVNEDDVSSPNPVDNHSASEKLKPSFKCLRLLTQSKARIETENKIIGSCSQNKLSSVKEGRNGPLVDLQKSKGSSVSVQQNPDLFDESCDLRQDRFDPMKSAVEKSKENIYGSDIASGKERQLDGPKYKGFKPPSMIGVPVVRKPLISPKPSSQNGGLASKNASKGPCVSQTELRFPSGSETEMMLNVLRKVVIPETFPTAGVYKQVLTAAITEYVNTQLLDIARKYHHALSKVDTSGYSESKAKKHKSSTSNSCPACQCGVPSKMICVKKEGPNCGRYFYACSASRQQQCKFFQWADENRKGGSSAGSRRKIQDGHSLGLYLKDQHIHFYGECQFVKRTKETINKYFKAPKWARGRGEDDTMQKKQMLLKLPHRSRSSMYAKDDIWVISQHLDFDPLQTFLGRSTFYGPSSSLEVEIEPITGYSPSNWKNGDICHAILAGNASNELSCLDNIREHIQPQTPPVLPYLLNRQTTDGQMVMASNSGFQPPRAVGNFQTSRNIHISSEQMDDLSRQYIDRYRLNRDQAEALLRVANMFCVEKCNLVDSILLIHGVFGAGKSFLLSVMVLFLVEVFKLNDSLSSGQTSPWKLLISSTTNVAVDRILNGLLDLGFEDFVRVGSVKKIAKPVLPYSVHASGTANQELKDLQEMLRSGELTNTEKSHVRKSIEKHRLGENKKKLGKVKVVGATCAACSLTCLNNMEFPLVLLDECSQMTEPASLLPVAKFACQKLLLVGDPKQLDPTIQGVEAAHQSGLEQTMFDRLVKMGCMPTFLRTQYRCHPSISVVANKLFYGGMLEDGITEEDRTPLLEMLPTICYFDVERGQECCEGAGSYYNEKEAQFVVFLLEVLLASGIEPAAIGVITLYRSQMARISDLLTGQGDNTEMKGIQVSTVDAFQGGERDVIILSTVRTDACGFIDNDKRTNVALTRARHHLLIVGNLNNLSKNVLWGKVIDHCRSFPRGIQSADEARQNLKNYMENQKISQTSLQNKTESQSSVTSEKPTRKRKARKKRHRSESEDYTVSPANTNTTEAENGKKFPTKQKTRYSDKQLSSRGTPVFSDGEDFEEQDRPQGGDFRLDLEVDDGFGGDCSNTVIQGNDSYSECSGTLSQSCDSRPISLSGSQDAEETVKPAPIDCERQRRKRPRHTARLNPISSDSDSNHSDDNLPPFDYT